MTMTGFFKDKGKEILKNQYNVTKVDFKKDLKKFSKGKAFKATEEPPIGTPERYHYDQYKKDMGQAPGAPFGNLSTRGKIAATGLTLAGIAIVKNKMISNFNKLSDAAKVEIVPIIKSAVTDEEKAERINGILGLSGKAVGAAAALAGGVALVKYLKNKYK